MIICKAFKNSFSTYINFHTAIIAIFLFGLRAFYYSFTFLLLLDKCRLAVDLSIGEHDGRVELVHEGAVKSADPLGLLALALWNLLVFKNGATGTIWVIFFGTLLGFQSR